MYCSHCGNQVNEGSAFCGKCGSPVGSRAPEQPAAPVWPQPPQPTASWTPPPAPTWAQPAYPQGYAQPAAIRTGVNPILRRIASVGGPLVLLCFFLPWLFASCSVSSLFTTENQGYSVSGLEIATGDYKFMDDLGSMAGMFGGDTSTLDDMNLEGQPALFLVPVLGLVGLAALNGRISGQFITAAAGLLGVIAMIVVSSRLGTVMDQAMAGGFSLEYRFGYYGSWIGFVLMLILGVAAVYMLRNDPLSG